MENVLFQLHTPQELVELSNFAHLVEGVLFGIVAVIAFIQTLGYFNSKRLQYLWPAFVFIAGFFLFPYILLHHGVDELGLSGMASNME
ncbi:MAG: hypothetical protein M3Q44_00115 [bacterium]|nr:hypothetical protein [bacterium]